ncbi:hypothetical protein CTAYLR_004199 [Chrysophaeum taylorii]|uniref:DUF4116 domain-containing protein n=1 Tax=Chrysophaeum taylorii TaxID=2483200 RepID=A0AAD7UJH2_9STRA|nr:hypothetical protein CTAYLR_004199 [Chrysophaeum taylorii]
MLELRTPSLWGGEEEYEDIELGITEASDDGSSLFLYELNGSVWDVRDGSRVEAKEPEPTTPTKEDRAAPKKRARLVPVVDLGTDIWVTVEFLVRKKEFFFGFASLGILIGSAIIRFLLIKRRRVVDVYARSLLEFALQTYVATRFGLTPALIVSLIVSIAAIAIGLAEFELAREPRVLKCVAGAYFAATVFVRVGVVAAFLVEFEKKYVSYLILPYFLVSRVLIDPQATEERKRLAYALRHECLDDARVACVACGGVLVLPVFFVLKNVPAAMVPFGPPKHYFDQRDDDDEASSPHADSSWSHRLGSLAARTNILLHFIENALILLLLPSSSSGVSFWILSGFGAVSYATARALDARNKQRQRRDVLALVRRNGRALDTVDPKYREDKEIVMAAVRQNGLALESASDNLKEDKEIVLAAVRQNGLALEDAADSLKKNEEVVLAAVQQDGWALEYASPGLKNDKDFILAAVHQNDEVQNAANELTTDDDEHKSASTNKKRSALELKNETDFLEAARAGRIAFIHFS